MLVEGGRGPRLTSTASTTIADTVPILTNSSYHATNIPITSQDVDELNPNAMVNGNTFVNPFANSSTGAAASSAQQNMDPSNMYTFYQPYPHEFQWTKDHPLEQADSLSSLVADFGPIPFKFYNSCLLDSNLQEMVKDFLEHHDHYTGQNPIGIKADENSKFFHAIVNQKHRYLSIYGIKHEGHWLTDPSSIKEVFLSFFESKFRRTDVANIVTCSPFYRRIQDDQNVALTSPTYEMEIRNAIWDCGSDKSSRPDGFSFAFYKKFWDSLKYDIMGFVQEFFKSSSLPRGCNASFIALIPKVAIEDAIVAGLYRGLKVRNISLSHLFFADEAVFIGDWLTENISSLVSILECFHKVSGLKINFHKSNLFGIGVNFDDVRRAATITGCNPMRTPFTYLGLPIDCNMVRLITVIHGGVENITTFVRNISSQSVWGRIVGSINTMHEKGFIPLSTLSRRVNNDADTKFWLESWMHNSPLYQQYPRLFRLALNKDCLVKDCWNNSCHVPWSHPILSGTNASHVAELYNKLAYFSLNDSEDIPPPSPTNIKDLFSWVDALHLSASKKSIVDYICGVVL
nr:RNA-directed DNA polymerase, eukaryota, reverse transcriptase zinc-binding domain protein [Tanacetum cinerariifolium]